MDLSFIRRNLRSFLRIPENTSLAATASVPTASLGGSPSEVQLLRPSHVVAQSAPVAPVAARPAARTVASPALHDTFKLYEEQLRLDFDLESKLALAQTHDASRQIRAAFAQFRASKLRGKTIADISKTPFALRPTAKAAPVPATDDDGTPVQTAPPDDSENPPGIDEIITQLLDIVLQLKKTVEVTADDDAEAVAALGHFGAGRKLTTSRKLMALTQRLCQRPKLPGISSTQSIAALTGSLENRRTEAHARMFSKLRGQKPVEIEATDDLATRRAKAQKAMFQNLQ